MPSVPRMKKALVSVVLGAAVFGAGTLAAIAVAGPNAPPPKSTTNTNAGNDRRGDTDTAPECPPGYGGDPCVHNGGGHGNCDDNQGNGSNGNDNGNFRDCSATTSQSSTTTTTTTAASTPGTTTTSSSVSVTTTTATTSVASTSSTTATSTPSGVATTSSSSSSTTTTAQAPTTTTVEAHGGTQTAISAPVTPKPTRTTHVALSKKRSPLPIPTPLRGHLPFTGIPIWIAALAGLFLLAGGTIVRRLARD